jgi:hypothetical protein
MSPPHEPVRIGRSFAIDERECVDFDSFTGSEGSSQAVLCQAFEIAADRFGSHRAGLLNGIPFGDEPRQRGAGHDVSPFLGGLKNHCVLVLVYCYPFPPSSDWR